MTIDRERTLARAEELERRIEVAMRAGASLDQVGTQIIDPSGSDDEHAAALWLYAHSFMERGRQRYGARQALIARNARYGATVAGTD